MTKRELLLVRMLAVMSTLMLVFSPLNFTYFLNLLLWLMIAGCMLRVNYLIFFNKINSKLDISIILAVFLLLLLNVVYINTEPVMNISNLFWLLQSIVLSLLAIFIKLIKE